jgi:hypothetical protein
VPKLVKGYHTVAGVTKEYDVFMGDLIEACAKFPGEWSRTAPAAEPEAAAAEPEVPLVPENPDAPAVPVAPVVEPVVPVPAAPGPVKGPGGRFQKKGS